MTKKKVLKPRLNNVFVKYTDNHITNEEITNIKCNSFNKIFNIFALINTKKCKNINTELDNILNDCLDSDISFIIWGVNHYLVYNSICRKIIDSIVNTQQFLDNRTFLKFFVMFCKQNNLIFPKFMQWYKSDSNSNMHFYNFIKEKYEFDDEDMDNLVMLIRERNLSIRDIYLNMEDE